MLKNNYTMIFKDHTNKILDPSGSELMSIAMKGSFHRDLNLDKAISRIVNKSVMNQKVLNLFLLSPTKI